MARRRLSHKYFVLFVTLVSGALLASGAQEIYFSYQESKAALVSVQREKAIGAATRIEQFVREIERQMGWTTHPQVVTGAAALEQRRIDDFRLLRQVPAITEISQLDARGREQLRVSRLAMDVVGSGTNFSDDPKFKEASAGRTYFSPVYFRKESEPYMTIAIAGSGKDAGVTVAAVNLKFIWDVVSQIKIGKAGHAYVVDAQGVLIAHPDISLVLQKTTFAGLDQVKSALAAPPAVPGERQEQVTIARDSKNRSVMTAYATIASLRWSVFVEQPLEEAFESLYASIQRTIALLVLGVLLAVAASLVLARRMVTPIQALQVGAARIGAANDQRKALVLDGECMWCGLLFRASLDRMTVSLQRELKWLKNQSTLSPPLAAYLQEDPPAARSTNAPGVTVVRSNPAQDKVLRNRFSTLQVVAGPPGTGKTQTIINLIASTVCDQQTVLFMSKNNTAVDNVYDAFVEQELFPGILRLGNQEARRRAVEQLRAVMERLQEGMSQPEEQAAFDAQGDALNREIACLEEELNEVSTLSATVQEMALLLRRVDADLQERGLYRYATDLAQQITVENAAQFQPPQLVGLRRLVARTAHWLGPPKRFWERLLQFLGITRWQQRARFEQELRALALPACCAVAGQEMQHRLDNLLRLDTIYPFLLATARHLKATSDLAATRSPDLIRGELEQVHQAKIDHGRRQLSRRWAEMVNAAQGDLSGLAELFSLFERMTEGGVETTEWQKWQDEYSKLLSIFPVICSTNLSLAGAAPNKLNLFHLVILDEASQSDIASFLPALYRAQRACVVGDDKQLRHISNLGTEEDERQMALAKVPPADTPSYHRHSAFDRAMAVAGRTAFTLLDRHYRCVPEIISFCNEHFHEGKLKIERSGGRGLPLPGGLPARGFLFDDIAAGQTVYRATAASRGASNRLEAERVIDLVQKYLAVGLTDIGVVTPFRAQRELLTELLAQARQAEGQPAIRAALEQVEIGTIHTFQGGQHQVMLLSTVVAPGAKEGTVHWFEENKNLLNVAISRAKDLLIVVGHHARLEQAGGILAAMVDYAARLAASGGALPPLPPGLRPERLGLLTGEQEILKNWLNPPGAVAEVLNGGEQELYRELLTRTGGRQIMVTPKMRVLDTLEPTRMTELTQPERDYAFRAHFDLVLVETQSFKPVAAVELDGATHEQDPLTMERDRLKNSICEKVGLPLLRVRWGD